MKPKITNPDCPYCGKPAVFQQTSAHLYHGTDWGPVYECIDCKAWVGCHKGTNEAYGRLANAELRKAKQEAHRLFDALWRSRMRTLKLSSRVARDGSYLWLARTLGITPQQCHIGMFDLDYCMRTIEACRYQPIVRREDPETRVVPPIGPDDIEGIVGP